MYHHRHTCYLKHYFLKEFHREAFGAAFLNWNHACPQIVQSITYTALSSRLPTKLSGISVPSTLKSRLPVLLAMTSRSPLNLSICLSTVQLHAETAKPTTARIKITIMMAKPALLSLQICEKPDGTRVWLSETVGSRSTDASLLKAFAVFEIAHVKDWMVSRWALPLGVRPIVFDGPVVVTRDVIVLLTNELKIAAGLITAERMRDARLSGVARMHKTVKSLLLSCVRGFGLGITATMLVIRARNVVIAPVMRSSSVGLRFKFVGQRERCHSAARCVRL